MTISIRTARTAVIFGGVLGGLYPVSVAFSEIVQIHPPTIQTPKINTPKVDLKINTPKVDTKIGTTKTVTIRDTKPDNKTDTNKLETTTDTSRKPGEGPIPPPPQGVTVHANSSPPTVTIDGKTIPLKGSEKYIKEAEEADVNGKQMIWVGNQLVPYTPKSAQAALNEEMQESHTNEHEGTKGWNAPKDGSSSSSDSNGGDTTTGSGSNASDASSGSGANAASK
jgi:hypothetical protein